MNRIIIISVFIIIQYLIFPYIAYPEQAVRVALVIGNAEYESSPLKNPTKDAYDMANTLRELGFKVTLKINVDKRSAENSIREFAKVLQEGVVGLFYYAGHGIQTSGSNYLIPIGATIESETDIVYEAIDLSYILGRMEEANNRLNIIILDACRNNPFTRYARGISKVGLAISSGPVGSIIAFATQPGAIAQDGEGPNGLYTSSLLNNIGTAGITIEEMFKKVRKEVIKKSDSKQIPWENTSLINTFYFNTTGNDIVVKKRREFYSIHIASFQRFEIAQRYVKSVSDRGEDIFIKAEEVPGRGIYYRIYLGEFKTREEAVKVWNELNQKGLVSYFGIRKFVEIPPYSDR